MVLNCIGSIYLMREATTCPRIDPRDLRRWHTRALRGLPCQGAGNATCPRARSAAYAANSTSARGLPQIHPIQGQLSYLWPKSTSVKTPEPGNAVSMAVIAAVAVSGDGHRQVICIKIGPGEAETHWTELRRRLPGAPGQRGIKLRPRPRLAPPSTCFSPRGVNSRTPGLTTCTAAAGRHCEFSR